ncbi:PorT family protein [Hymenobacter sp. BT594]|uniref:PorT family protein n=2 Tax=Hymenobacter guriensis TaxID=2793065 RepID=A0ABS0KZ11_9BACT|nr:PorT family protein [Hymenobacter guriensis]
MKKFLLAGLIAGIMLGMNYAASAQTPGGTRVGIKLGASLSTLSGTINSEAHMRGSLMVGTLVRFKPSKQLFSVQAELNMQKQGANIEYDDGQREERDPFYFNVPVLLRQYIRGPLYVNVGPQLGLRTGSSKSPLKSTDISVVGGLGFEAANGFVFDARLNYGLLDIDNDPQTQSIRRQLGFGGLYNRVAQFSVGYLFGKK